MSFRINRIIIQNFRGIRRLDLPVNGRNLIIAGENGSGKSSIIDALEYYFTGRVSQLEGRSDVNKRRSIPNLNGGTTTVALSFKSGQPEQMVVKSYPSGSVKIPDNLRSFFALANNRPFVLRRAQLLNFINARDAERYRQVSQLIGLGDLDKIEQNWKKARDERERAVTQLEAQEEDILERLSDLTGYAIVSEDTLLKAVNDLLIQPQLPPIGGWEEITAVLKTLRQSDAGSGAALAQRREIQGDVGRLSGEIEKILAAQSALQTATAHFLQQAESLVDASLEKLLLEGEKILTGDAARQSCPLCASPVDHTALLRQIERRLVRLRALTDSRQEVDRQKELTLEQLVILLEHIRELAESLKAVGEERSLPAMRDAYGRFQKWKTVLESEEWQKAVHAAWADDQAVRQMQQSLTQFAAANARAIAAQTPSADEAARQELLHVLTRVDEQWQRLAQIQQALIWARYKAAQVDRVYRRLLAVRKQGVENLLDALETDFDRFYRMLHPGEGYEAIRIPVQKQKRGSLALRAGFHRHQDAHPLNFFSEGHLDSLGLCIFLSFIKRFNGDLKLIVLDDVLTTVDSAHRLRVARMLAQEFSRYQFVITTHDRLWAKELERILPRTFPLLLGEWSFQRGAIWREEPLSNWDYYLEQARNGRPQDAIAGTGRDLEKFLSRMRINLRLAIPARPNEAYTIGDLYPPFWRWVNKRKIQRPDRPHFAGELLRIREDLDAVWPLRNWSGAHFNEWGEKVTAAEAIDFVQASRDLAEAFACPVCRNLVVYREEAQALVCPHCQPPAPAAQTWEYSPGWYDTAVKLSQADKPEVRGNVVPMTQRICRSFFRDMRRLLPLSLMAAPDDQYDLPQLYVPFFDQIPNYPRPDLPDWTDLIAKTKQDLDQYWRGEQWVYVPDEEIMAFVTIVHRLTKLFACSQCGRLMRYNSDRGDYACPVCYQDEAVQTEAPAYWPSPKAGSKS